MPSHLTKHTQAHTVGGGGKSEGALIREVVDRFLVAEQEADALWEAMIARWALNPVTNEPRTWTRSDLYEDRVGKFHADPH